MSTKIPSAIDHAIAAVKKAPRLGGKIHWAGDITVPTLVALAILTAPDSTAAAEEISKATGASMYSMLCFCRGKRPDNSTWPELRKMLDAEDIDWMKPRRGRPRKDGADNERRPVAPSPIDVAGNIVMSSAPEVERNRQEMATIKGKDDADGMLAAHHKGIAVATAQLAVTNKGEVVTAPLPVAAVAPKVMAATPGEFAVKTSTKKTAIDPATGDCIVTITTRSPYGTPGHREAMLAVVNRKP